MAGESPDALGSVGKWAHSASRSDGVAFAFDGSGLQLGDRSA